MAKKPVFVEQDNMLNPLKGINVGYDPKLAVGDLDGDGDEDVLVGIDNGEIKYFRNDGDSFIKLKGNDNPFKGVKLDWDAEPAVGDLDGDGDEDVLVGIDNGKIKYRMREIVLPNSKEMITPLKE